MGLKDIAPSLAQKHLPLAGRIAHFIRNWEVVTSDAWVLNAVKGYELDLSATPYQCLRPKELTFGEDELATLDMEIAKMKQKGAICLADKTNTGFYSQLFVVPKKDGGHRPIINLKKLNQFVKPQHFKMESINMLKDILKRGDYMTKVDLKDAYFMVPLRDKHRNLTRFTWKGSTFQFNCLPFGLSSAPWVFTKITRPIMTVLRSMGLRTIMYIDDILILAESETQAREHTAALIFLLENVGMVINHPKSQTTPSQVIEFLGFIIDSTTMELKLPGEKIKKIRGEARRLISQPVNNALALSRFLGKLNHATQAIPPAPLFYRSLQGCLKEALNRGSQEYQTTISLDEEAREELSWWEEHLRTWNGRSLLSPPPSLTIETDASTIGWGAFCQGERTGGAWSQAEREMHINGLELLGATLAVKCFAKEQSNLTILLRIDNTTAISYINRLGGTVSPQLNQLTRDLWLWCMNRSITLKAVHLAGKLNTVADEESRVMKDRTDWQLCPDAFQTIIRLRGPLQVDLFASRLSYQLPDYVSWRPDPGAMACDAFSLDWSQLKGYANPPWNLIGKVLSQVRAQKARLVLVTPLWKAQPWYPAILNMTTQIPILMRNRHGLIQPTHPSNKPDIYPHLVAWTISGKDTEPKEFQAMLQNCYWPHGDKSHPSHTTRCSQSGQAGVVNGVVIPFQEM